MERRYVIGDISVNHSLRETEFLLYKNNKFFLDILASGVCLIFRANLDRGVIYVGLIRSLNKVISDLMTTNLLDIALR